MGGETLYGLNAWLVWQRLLATPAPHCQLVCEASSERRYSKDPPAHPTLLLQAFYPLNYLISSGEARPAPGPPDGEPAPTLRLLSRDVTQPSGTGKVRPAVGWGLVLHGLRQPCAHSACAGCLPLRGCFCVELRPFCWVQGSAGIVRSH